MPRLSNFFRPRDRQTAGGAICRQVHRPEIESALRLLLATENGLAGDDVVLDFLGFAMARKIDLNQTWIALVGDRIAWALLPISNPGRTLMLFTPGRIPHATPIDAARHLTEQVCSHWQAQGVHLAQFLLDPEDTAVCELYSSCGFEILAELLYLQTPVREPAPAEFPAGFELETYTDANHGDFAEAIAASYDQSLDCPLLNGKRSIEDVIAGHKATGSFDPTLWHLLKEHGQTRGVLILSPSTHNEAVELVYLGLSVQSRRRGLGDAMMRLAFCDVARLERNELSLAVDSRNEPALRLYFRHGFERIGSRIALVRDLRPAPVGSGPVASARYTSPDSV